VITESKDSVTSEQGSTSGYPDYRPVASYPAPGDAAARAAAGPGAAMAPHPGGPAARRAVLAYLTVPVCGFVFPLLIYLGARRRPRWTRAHAAHALNVWITGALYDLSALIMATMLALDSAWAALAVFGPLVAVRWAVTIAYLVRAALAARRGTAPVFPAWMCIRIAR